MTERRILPHPHGQGGDRFVLVGGDVPWTNGIGFRSEAMAEKAQISTLAEAFTLLGWGGMLHAVYRRRFKAGTAALFPVEE
jgi:hypothetical protein